MIPSCERVVSLHKSRGKKKKCNKNETLIIYIEWYKIIYQNIGLHTVEVNNLFTVLTVYNVPRAIFTMEVVIIVSSVISVAKMEF